MTAAQCGRLIRCVPEREGHSLEVQWPTLPSPPHYRAAPAGYVSHMLGHEGEGSAFAVLKARGWATSLVAGEAGTSYSGRSFFMCRVELTEEGQRRAGEVGAVIFAYLALLRGPGGVQERAWREMQALARLRFDYRDQVDPASYASSLAQGMQASGGWCVGPGRAKTDAGLPRAPVPWRAALLCFCLPPPSTNPRGPPLGGDGWVVGWLHTAAARR